MLGMLSWDHSDVVRPQSCDQRYSAQVCDITTDSSGQSADARIPVISWVCQGSGHTHHTLNYTKISCSSDLSNKLLWWPERFRRKPWPTLPRTWAQSKSAYCRQTASLNKFSAPDPCACYCSSCRCSGPHFKHCGLLQRHLLEQCLWWTKKIHRSTFRIKKKKKKFFAKKDGIVKYSWVTFQEMSGLIWGQTVWYDISGQSSGLNILKYKL